MRGKEITKTVCSTKLVQMSLFRDSESRKIQGNILQLGETTSVLRIARFQTCLVQMWRTVHYTLCSKKTCDHIFDDKLK